MHCKIAWSYVAEQEVELEKMKTLKTIKTTVYEKRKIRIFQNRLVDRFGQEFEISSTLIFIHNRPRKSIWERTS